MLRLHRLLKKGRPEETLKFLGVLIGPTGGHYHHSSPMDLLVKKMGGSDHRQAKAK